MRVGDVVLVNISSGSEVLRPAFVVNVLSDSQISVRVLSDGSNDAAMMAALGCPVGYPDWLENISHTDSSSTVAYRTWVPVKGE